MKARQAKKILRPLRGGRTSKLSRYWWFRVMSAVIKGDHHDHRVINAMKITKEEL